MGRRKIEIQPITHERNRSVTFLKRKNGLFKKAYELGVLCSVDVAVIIFEDRPGHELKLHEYSSCDIRDIVQRQLRHQGDIDARGPSDFSGGSAAKFDAEGDGDDDGPEDEDEDVPVSVRTSKRRRGGPRLADADGDSDYIPPSSLHRNGHGHSHSATHSRLPPPPTASTSSSIHTRDPASMMPVSNDRGSAHPRAAKRQRTSLSGSAMDLDMDIEPGMDSGSDVPGGRGPGPELYLPDQHHHQQPARFNRMIRQAHNTGSGSMGPPQHPHGHYHPQDMQGPGQTGYGQNYTPLFPVGQEPPSFIPLHGSHGPGPEYGQHTRGGAGNAGGGQYGREGPYGGSSGSRGGGGPGSAGGGGRYDEPQYDPALYGPMGISGVPVSSPGINPNINPNLGSTPSGGLGGYQQQPQQQHFPTHSPLHRQEERADMFDAFFEADRRRAAQAQQQQAQTRSASGLEWPSHQDGAEGGGEGPNVAHQMQHNPNANASNSSGGGDGGGGSWFDVFSGTQNTNAPINTAAGAVRPGPSPGSRSPHGTAAASAHPASRAPSHSHSQADLQNHPQTQTRAASARDGAPPPLPVSVTVSLTSTSSSGASAGANVTPPAPPSNAAQAKGNAEKDEHAREKEQGTGGAPPGQAHAQTQEGEGDADDDADADGEGDAEAEVDGSVSGDVGVSGLPATADAGPSSTTTTGGVRLVSSAAFIGEVAKSALQGGAAATEKPNGQETEGVKVKVLGQDGDKPVAAGDPAPPAA